MISFMTKNDSGWIPDRFLAQPETGLIEQTLITTYRDSNGRICQKTINRTFFEDDEYNDTSSSKILG